MNLGRGREYWLGRLHVALGCWYALGICVGILSLTISWFNVKIHAVKIHAVNGNGVAIRGFYTDFPFPLWLRDL